MKAFPTRQARGPRSGTPLGISIGLRPELPPTQVVSATSPCQCKLGTKTATTVRSRLSNLLTRKIWAGVPTLVSGSLRQQ